MNDIRAAIDRDEFTLLILYDFKKAFDSIGHVFLITVLRYFNFSDHAISFIHIYLSDRSMMCNGSSKCNYSCGVGQGSGPGCDLFLAFINSVFGSFIYLLVLLFIDDAQVLCILRLTS